MQMAKNVKVTAPKGCPFWFSYLLSKYISKGKSVEVFFKNLNNKSIQMGIIHNKSTIYIPKVLQKWKTQLNLSNFPRFNYLKKGYFRAF